MSRFPKIRVDEDTKKELDEIKAELVREKGDASYNDAIKYLKEKADMEGGRDDRLDSVLGI